MKIIDFNEVGVKVYLGVFVVYAKKTNLVKQTLRL